MLNRELVIKEINRVVADVFRVRPSMPWLTLELFKKLTMSEHFKSSVYAARAQHALAYWHGELADIASVNTSVLSYAVLGIDGSQIYPDNHIEGIDCFLINTGGCFVSYSPLPPCHPELVSGSIPSSYAKLFSSPIVYTPGAQTWPGKTFSTDLVDLVREEHEFASMAENLPTFKYEGLLFGLFDGNLLFWYLESKQRDVQMHYMQHYTASLQLLYEQKFPTAGYLSASRFSDIVQIMQHGITPQNTLLTHEQFVMMRAILETATDGELLAYILQPGQRTPLFMSMGDIADMYPEALRPWFLYLHVGSEVVRIEIPAWMANDKNLVDLLCAVCIDQCEKGQGYPVALAEAHAQAVVQSADREFFYQMLLKRGLESQSNVRLSPKSFKKRMLGF